MMMVDDWGSYDASWRIRDLGRTPDIATPNIDALSSTGIRFANCVSVVICICFYLSCIWTNRSPNTSIGGSDADAPPPRRTRGAAGAG